MKNTILKSEKITKTYTSGETEIKVLKGIDMRIKEGEFAAITGRSGAGKSTLLYVLSLLDKPTTGRVLFEGCETITFSDKKYAECRLHHFGFVFQYHALLPELTALENVMLPEMVRVDNWRKVKKKSESVLKKVGLGDRLENYPSQLSGGEKQRVSLARAVASEPEILFADEPTASLDSKRAESIMDLISDVNKEGITVVLVTHGEKYTNRADRVLTLKDGKIINEN